MNSKEILLLASDDQSIHILYYYMDGLIVWCLHTSHGIHFIHLHVALWDALVSV